MSDTVAVHLFVRGRVQGVFYRASTQKKADKLGLAGWVRNCPDGSVEIHAEGDREKVEALIAWCRKGPPMASVTDVEQEWVEPEGLTSLEVR